MIARLVGVAVGVWLVAAPAVLGYGNPAQDNDRVVGPIAASLSFVALWQIVRSLRWGVLPLAAWLVIAPLLLGYDDAATVVNSIACGVLLVPAAVIRGRRGQEFGGGWASLRRRS